jgi:A/G-specific adenine glycosylase
MELGATICTPRRPRCAECPLARVCAARRRGLQDEIPPPKAAPRRAAVHHHSILIGRDGRVLLVPRPREGLWAGLWQPPTVEAPRALRAAALAARSPLAVRDVRPAGALRWLTTHRDVRFHLFTALLAAPSEAPGAWVDPAAPHVPMANAHRAILRAWTGDEAGLSSPPRARGRRRRAPSSSSGS